MRREMVTVPAFLAFTGYALHLGLMPLAIAGLVLAGVDALTGRA